jgi:hypothetical protein
MTLTTASRRCDSSIAESKTRTLPRFRAYSGTRDHVVRLDVRPRLELVVVGRLREPQVELPQQTRLSVAAARQG